MTIDPTTHWLMKMNSLTLLAIVVLAGLATAYRTPASNARIQQYLGGRYESETLEQLLNALMAKQQLQEMETANTMTIKRMVIS